MLRTILCPVDFSAHSRQALRYGALLAARAKGRLIVIFVQDPLLLAAAAAAEYGEKVLMASLHAQLTRFVDRTVAPYGLKRDAVTLEVAAGQPYREIKWTAERFGCDLVVMGTHGATGAGRLVFGSTTHRVLRHVPVPVLAIPPVARRSRPPSRRWPGRFVMAPIDLGRKDRADAKTAALVAAELGAHLLLLHVVEPGDTSIWQHLDLPRPNRERILKARAEAQLESLKTITEASVPTEYRVLHGAPAARIAAAAADSHVGLVLMTRRRGQGLFGARQGSISYRVLCNADTPVLALPGDARWIRRAISGKSKRPAA